jgi:UDP-glucose 4-epimerase
MNSKWVVVTGEAGFIGSHLTEELGRGYQVIILDDLSTGKMENTARLINSTNSTTHKTRQDEFILGSVANLPLLQKLFQDIKNVFRPAARAVVSRSIEDPLTANQVNATCSSISTTTAQDRMVTPSMLLSFLPLSASFLRTFHLLSMATVSRVEIPPH